MSILKMQFCTENCNFVDLYKNGGAFMSELYNRIDKLCKDRGINVTQLCREAKINRSTLSELNKGRTKTLSYTVSKKIAGYFGIPLSEVYDGEEPKTLNIKLTSYIPNKAKFKEAVNEVTLKIISENTYYIPVYESVSAGFGAYANDYVIDYTPLFIATPEEARNTMVIVVSGNSMYPKIEDGDEIQVLRQDWAENGDIAVVLIDDDDAVVKKYECDAEKETVSLISINPEYAPRIFEGKEIERLRVLGVVKKIIKEP